MLLDDSEILNKRLEADYPMTFGQTLGFALSEEISDGLGGVYSEDDNGNLSIDRTNIRLTASRLLRSSTTCNTLNSITPSASCCSDSRTLICISSQR